MSYEHDDIRLGFALGWLCALFAIALCCAIMRGVNQ